MPFWTGALGRQDQHMSTESWGGSSSKTRPFTDNDLGYERDHAACTLVRHVHMPAVSI